MRTISAWCGVLTILCATAHGAEPDLKWKNLFNGKDLTGWKSSGFGGDGEVSVVDGAIRLGRGEDMTGITYQGEPPKMNYEIAIESQRVEGIDFFSALTFPVGDAHATFVAGGWSGGVTGISCINGADASDNETTQFKSYKDKQWYRFRVRVMEKRIQAWVDQEKIVDFETEGRKFSLRGEVDNSKPLGLSSWRTVGEIKKIEVRTLTAEEIAAGAKK